MLLNFKQIDDEWEFCRPLEITAYARIAKAPKELGLT